LEEQIESQVVNFMNIDRHREYTIPEVMTGVDVKNREKAASALARLEGQGIVELSRKKGRTKYYRLK